LAIIVACQLMLVVDASIVNVALPSMQRALHFSATGLAWVPSLYTLVFGGLLLLGGRTGDIVGRRRTLVAGIAVFTAASLIGGFATTASWLLAARAVQGAAAAFAGPSTLSLIVANFPEGQARNRALGAFSAAAGLGVAAGYITGGILTAQLSWRWVMFINVPFGLAVTVLAPLFIAEPQRHRGRIDLPGALISTAGMAALTYAFIRVGSTGWNDRTALTAFTAAPLLLAGFVAIQARTANPVMPLRLFSDRNRTAALLNMFFLAAAMTGMVYFLSQFLQEVLGLNPLRAGLAVLPLAATQLLSARLAPRMVARLGPKPITIAGTVLITAAFAWLARISAATGYLSGLLGPIVLFGLGVGLAFMPLNMIIVGGVPSRDSGAVAGLLQTMQRIGGSVGVAVLVTVFGATRHATTHPTATTAQQQAHTTMAHAIASAFTLGTEFCACALIIATFVITTPRTNTTRPAHTPAQDPRIPDKPAGDTAGPNPQS
jgi:EmrB/QacA subfamily drug resistance transporter